MDAADALVHAGPGPGKKRILLADDEEIVRKTVRLVLGFQGYEVVEALDGEDAVRKYSEASPRFDLVLLDVDMPRMGGMEALAQIRASHGAARVIVLSGMPHHPGGENIVFIQKPFDYHQFLRRVREMLGEPAGVEGEELRTNSW